jgi:hypothetical protein
VAHSGGRWAPHRLQTLLTWKSGACVCPKDMPSPEQKDRRVNSRERVVLLPVLSHTLDNGFWHPRVQTRDGITAGPDGYRACPGATTMQGCWLAASRAQAAFAALAERLLRRARYKTLPPKAEVGKSSIWAEVSRSTSAS